MATISITIPDAQVPRVLAAFGHRVSRNQPSTGPATPAEFKAQIVAFVRGVVRKVERDAYVAGADATITDVDVT